MGIHTSVDFVVKIGPAKVVAFKTLPFFLVLFDWAWS